MSVHFKKPLNQLQKSLIESSIDNLQKYFTDEATHIQSHYAFLIEDLLITIRDRNDALLFDVLKDTFVNWYKEKENQN